MHEIITQYGSLNGISRYSTYENGQLDYLCLENENKINTPFGTLIPRYEDCNGRRKTTKCLSFYPSGTIKSIDLQKQTTICTSIGSIEAELVTFYESGSLKRIFPLNGAINGFWSEADEAQLCKKLSFNLLNTNFILNVNSICFYPNGNVRSVSFFPEETALVPTPCGDIYTRIGLSLSDDGSLRTLEPATPVELHTPIGILHAYDTNAIGIHSDSNSLVFEQNKVFELISSTDIIKITDKLGRHHIMEPGFAESNINLDENELVPMKVRFNTDSVTFITYSKFTIYYSDIEDIKINTIPLFYNGCTDCASCGKCK